MSDYSDIVMRLAVGSEILRTKPGALIQILASGTSSPVIAETTSDANGEWEIASLDTGHYDIKIDGQVRSSFHHVKADHSHKANETWQTFLSNPTVDSNESNSKPIFTAYEAGVIEKVAIIVQSVDATGDLTVHILQGSNNGASILTFAGDSVWNYRINPGSAYKRFTHIDDNPGITLAANDCITIGIDFTSTTVTGVTIILIFRPS